MRHPFPASPLPRLYQGQKVHVNTRSGWLDATVAAVNHKLVEVSYQRLVPSYSSLVDAHLVWPADGIMLRPVAALQPGDRVVDFDNVRTVACTWRGRDGWVISYTDGGPVTVPPSVVLRLADRNHLSTPPYPVR